MRRVVLGGTGIETSALGFGCASLGSRVDAREGARALAAAHEGGVTWFDLAPVYGGGRAEAIAAPFLQAHRADVQICTKAGLALAGGSVLRRALAPLARQALPATGPLGGRLRAAAPRANRKLPLTPELLAGSLDASLRRLGTDYVDLFALHGPTAAEVRRDDILRALEAILSTGKARAVAVAGDAAAAASALAQGAPYGVVQLALPALGADDSIEAASLTAARAAGIGTIVHSVFARAAGVASEHLLARAFALNPDGVVLASMLSATSRAQNLAAASATTDANEAAEAKR